MNTRDLITELENQKELLGKGFFNQELLEKYLDASYLKKSESTEIENQIELYGLDSIESLQTNLNRIYPYTTAKPRFNRIKASFNVLYNITKTPTKKVSVNINNTISRQKQKTFKQDKAA